MKLWGGRFTKEENRLADNFNASIEFDKRLYKHDIQGSIVHSRMLNKCGIISDETQQNIENGLISILHDIENDNIKFTVDNEDIHMNIESILTERIGNDAKTLHTARSRNDQIALDFKMYIMDETHEICSLLKNLMEIILDIASSNQKTVMPGYTHLQRAQPVTLAFYMLAYFQMFKRDYKRFVNAYTNMNEMPLGSCAMSGTSYETDRKYLQKELGFASITENAMDSVSDRDFALEFLFCCEVVGIHLSRFAEELILWSSKEFGFIEIDDSFATGSSIMPQKKNPDMAELIRGKTGRLAGNLINLLTVMKGLPLAYNKDMQEDKLPVFDSADTVKDSLKIFALMLNSIDFKIKNMENACKHGFTNATDAADYLAQKGIPFRECHEIIGKLVLHCIDHNKSIEDLTIGELKAFSDQFEEDIYDEISISSCINRKISEGGTGFKAVSDQLKLAEEWIKKQSNSFLPSVKSNLVIK